MGKINIQFSAQKANIWSYIILVISIILGVFSGLLFATETAAMRITGVAVDSSGLLYVGRFHQIEVYRENVCVEKIPVPQYRSWSFYLGADDSVVVVTNSQSVVIDKSGEVINKQATGASVLELWKLPSFTGNNGLQYNVIDKWALVGVQAQDGSIIYRMPVIDLLANYSFVLSIIGLLVAIWTIRHNKAGDGLREP